MEHPIIQIKNAITALLKGIDPDTDVFYEEIKGTEEKHGLDEPETYYFVDIIPNGNETVDRFFTDMGVLVDIAYHEKSESNTAYLIKGAEIDAVVRPVFSFGDRNITINDANMKVSDHVLHYSFTINFRQAREQTNEFEPMGIEVLVTRSNINENPDLTARGKMAAGCDLFVSNHTNACGTEAVNRAVAIHFTDRNETLVDDQSREFAAQIAKVIQNTMGVDGYQIYSRLSDNDRDGNGKKDDNYYGVLNGSFLAGVPGVIAEHSFHTNTEACKWLMDDSNLRKLAKACAECMASFVGASVTVDTGIQAVEFANMADTDIVKRVGELCTADMKNTGILASVSAAQFILESGYGKSVLAQMANNCFGMKCSLSGNTWSGSSWDGTSEYTKETKEYVNGEYVTVTAAFRAYPNVEASIADHSAYLLGAKKGEALRYAGLKGEKDYKKAVQIIKDGGYATAPDYVNKVCSIIEKYNLTAYDQQKQTTAESWYRVRKNWSDAKSQIGAYHSLEYAKTCVDKNPGYSVFDEAGVNVYPENVFAPYMVRVKISDLKMRLGATIDTASVGHIPVGSYTIVEEKYGKVSKSGEEGLWGRIKSEQPYNGKYVPVWICLSYTEKV